VLSAGMIAFFLFDLDRYLNLEALRVYRSDLREWVDQNEIQAVAYYMAAYATLVAMSVPGAGIMTLAGGFLFGTIAATIYTVAAATAGATVLFIAVRWAFADLVAAKAGPAIKRMEAGFRRNALAYLIFLRLVPVFPFWLVNLVPALLGVRPAVFALGTAIGIVPGTFIFAGVGNGLAVVFEHGGGAAGSVLAQPQVLLPILGLAALSLLAPLYGWIKGHRRRDAL
jgi:Uncharacterized conserved protein